MRGGGPGTRSVRLPHQVRVAPCYSSVFVGLIFKVLPTQAKVCDLGPTSGIQQHVLRLQVAVQDRRLRALKCLQCRLCKEKRAQEYKGLKVRSKRTSMPLAISNSMVAFSCRPHFGAPFPSRPYSHSVRLPPGRYSEIS